MMVDVVVLAQEAKRIHEIFQGLFYIFATSLLCVGLLIEYFRWPIGGAPNFTSLVGRVLVAALILHAYPEITNAIAALTDAIAHKLGGLNNFDLVLDRMGGKLESLSWSWVSVKDSIILVISFLTFFLLYFSVHLADAFYIFVWTMLYIFSPLLIALYVLPQTARATSALFKGLIEVACWKIVWSVTATLLWSCALSQINQNGSNISFLTAIGFNVLLAASLLLTPFIVNALSGSGLTKMVSDVGTVALGGWQINPQTVAQKSSDFSRFTVNRVRSFSSSGGGTKPKSTISSKKGGRN